MRFLFIVNKRYGWIVGSSGGLSPLRQQLKLILDPKLIEINGFSFVPGVK